VAIASSQTPSRRRAPLSIRQREAILGYLYVSPWIIGFIVLTLGPMVASLYLSLTDYNVITRPVFIGIGNYTRAFGEDKLFGVSLWNTFYYVLISMPAGILISLLLALLLNQKVKGTNVFRTLFFLPTIVPAVAAILLWNWLFQPDFGLINYTLSFLGIKGPKWLASTAWVKPSLIFIGLWGSVGGSRMIILLAGLQSIPRDLYEAAAIDGAGAWHRFRNITLPMLTPAIFFNVIVGVIEGFRTFTGAFVATDGGPAYASLFYMLYLFQNAFSFLNMGYASALAWILFVIVLILTVIQFRASRQWVYYEGGE
jgi:multiple sugar transport system permease protein